MLSLLGASALFYHAPASLVALTGRFDFVVAYLKSIPLALLYAVPFTFCGLMLGLLLSARQFPTRRVYFFDLAGSAVGAFAVLPAITHLGVEGGLLLAGGAMLLGTLLLAPPRRTGSRVVAALAGLALLGATGARETVFDLSYPKGSMATRTFGSLS